MWVSGFFGLFALFLVFVGIYCFGVNVFLLSDMFLYGGGFSYEG